MKQPKPILHQGDHRPRGWFGTEDPGGADPMSWLTNGSGLEYNDPNDTPGTRYLETTTNDLVPSSADDFNATGYGTRITDGNASGGILLETVGTEEPTITIKTAVSSDGNVDIYGDGNVNIWPSSGSLTLYSDGPGGPVSTIDLNDLTILMSLLDGGTFTINDHLGNPLVTYTG